MAQNTQLLKHYKETKTKIFQMHKATRQYGKTFSGRKGGQGKGEMAAKRTLEPEYRRVIEKSDIRRRTTGQQQRRVLRKHKRSYVREGYANDKNVSRQPFVNFSAFQCKF